MPWIENLAPTGQPGAASGVDPFGAALSRGQVAKAVTDTLSGVPTGSTFPLIAFYVAAAERKLGLAARSTPLPGAFRSGLDFETFKGDELPLIIVVAQPIERAERVEAGAYMQTYETQVGAVVEDPEGDEVVAQQLADTYGLALTLAIAQNGSLGGVSQDTVLDMAARTEFVDPGARRFARTIVTFRVMVDQVVQEGGPLSLGTDPYTAPAAPGTFSKISIGLTGEAPLGTLSPLSGATVTSADGHVIITE